MIRSPRWSWDRRVARAAELSREYPAVSGLLKFYQRLACFQRDVYERLASSKGRAAAPDVAVLLSFFPGLFACAKDAGSPDLIRAAEALERSASQERLELLEGIWRHRVEPGDLANEYALLIQAMLQPYAEFVAEGSRPTPGDSSAVCPFCGSRPQVAVLRQEGDGGRRSLLCSLCSGEWGFRRVLCPNCGEEDKDRLPIFSAPEFDHVRVDACDSCRAYIKCVDLTRNGRAVPMVDELATLSLNFWAQENSYRKAGPNLFGV